ncbi:MFS transporter [Francisellaceae bacterium]|nr:MFS transporter [Francisellaceae bacterium]
MPYQKELSKLPLSKSWFVVIVTSLFFFYEFGLGTVFNSLSKPIMESYQLSVVSLGFLSSLYFYTDILFLVPAAILLDKYSPKNCIIVALCICSAGIIAVSIAHDFYTLAISRLLMGFGGSFSLVGCIRIATNWFPAKKMGFVIGIVIAIGMLGGWFAQHPLAIMVDGLGWREALLVVGILGFVIMALILVFVRSAPKGLRALRTTQKQELREMPIKSIIKMALSNPQTWYCALYTGLINVATFMLGGLWANEYLTHAKNGFTSLDASSITGFLFLGMLPGFPFWGMLSEKIQKRKSPMIYGAILALIVIFLIMFSPGNTAWFSFLFFALGFTTSAQTIAYPVVGEINSMRVTSTATSVVSINSLLWGGVIAEPLFGYLMIIGADIFNVSIDNRLVYEFAIWIVPIAFILSVVISFLIKETYCKRLVD